ncbi:MAG: hypothetical protein U9R34_02820 [Nanoarchaeota archaeon]|nr:hypothetical protein [Nanoarchaeota archaeon]
MEKKLTAQGPRDRKSYTVTLPIEWIKMQELDKTKSVELDIIGNKVIISQHKEKEQMVIINGRDYPTSMIKVLQGLYRAGVNEVRLNLADNSMVEEILDIIEKKLIGYEIIEQKKDYLIIKDITKESEEDFKIVFRRIFLLLLELSESDDIVQIKTLDRNIKKLINYCQRILMKKGHVEFTKTPLYYLILDRLEKLKDEFNWLLQITAPNKKEYPELKEINILLRKAYELFYKYDAKRYGGYEYRTFQLKNKIKLDVKVEPAVIHLHNLARILNSLYGDIFTLRFDE